MVARAKCDAALEAFSRHRDDEREDSSFYAEPRMVQHLDATAEGGLRDMPLSCGPRKIVRVGKRQEVLQYICIHAALLKLSLLRTMLELHMAIDKRHWPQKCNKR